jgi:type VI secretion system protein VasG
MLAAITKLQLGRIQKRIQTNHKVPFSYDDEVIKLIVERCTELESGGRMIDALLTNTLLPSISQEFLTCMIEGKPVERVAVKVVDGEFSYSFESDSVADSTQDDAVT